MSMRIIIFGAAGQIGTDCTRVLKEHGYEVIPLTRDEVDFSDAQKVSAVVIDYSPAVVVNACAYTAVDKAETDSVLADQINHRSVASLAGACEQEGVLLVHLSTDYVFDGRSSTPYDENAPVNPLGVYGKTKLAGEQAIARVMSQYFILRTSWVFGQHGSNFVSTMLRLAAERDQLSVVSDQRGRPSYAAHLVDVIVLLIQRYESQEIAPFGIYHCSNDGELSWYEFAQAIFANAHERGVLNRLPTVSAIPSSAYPTPAPRPMYSVLNTAKLESVLGRGMPTWQQGLSDYFTRS
jgi:dTDP-4-dehydrorhamnose reductase